MNPAKHADGFDPYSLIHACVDVYDYPDGRFEVIYQGRQLPYRIYNKSARVQQGDIVASKRLGDVLSFIKESQDAGKAKTYVQKRSRTVQKVSVISKSN